MSSTFYVVHLYVCIYNLKYKTQAKIKMSTFLDRELNFKWNVGRK